MTEHYTDEANRLTVHHGDCVEVLKQLPDNSVDAVVTDPPYGLEFMGKEWDSFRGGAGIAMPTHLGERPTPWVSYGKGIGPMQQFGLWCEQWAAECLRVLKPGGHMLAFGGTRTFHRLAVAVEEAGFEIRDSLAWMYGSGFPKSLDVSKAMDKAAGHVRGERGELISGNNSLAGPNYERTDKGEPITDEAKQWQGWGTALKPSFEPIVVARKPLKGTVIATVKEYGTGALNIDGCRIEGAYDAPTGGEPVTTNDVYGHGLGVGQGPHELGRWPGNVVLDPDQADELDRQSGETRSPASRPRTPDGPAASTWALGRTGGTQVGHDDIGGASRFFYVAKPDGSERVWVNGVAHPTVKPLALMRWLVRLVTPPDGVVLEPFAGSGTTVEACLLEGVGCIAIEKSDEYLPLIQQRIDRRLRPADAVNRARGGRRDDTGQSDLFELLGNEEGESA